MNGIEFSPLQRRCLDALGYTRHVLVDTAQSSAPVGTRADPAVAIAPMAKPHQPSRTRPVAPSTADARDQRLLDAIVNAAGRPAQSLIDPVGWLQGLDVPGLDVLRTDPSAKRRLWSRLRIERRTR